MSAEFAVRVDWHAWTVGVEVHWRHRHYFDQVGSARMIVVRLGPLILLGWRNEPFPGKVYG